MNGGEAIISRHIILIIIMSKFVYPFIDMDWYALLLYLSICNDYSVNDFLSLVDGLFCCRLGWDGCGVGRL